MNFIRDDDNDCDLLQATCMFCHVEEVAMAAVPTALGHSYTLKRLMQQPVVSNTLQNYVSCL